jgi:hypothetical protein
MQSPHRERRELAKRALKEDLDSPSDTSDEVNL